MGERAHPLRDASAVCSNACCPALAHERGCRPPHSWCDRASASRRVRTVCRHGCIVGAAAHATPASHHQEMPRCRPFPPERARQANHRPPPGATLRLRQRHQAISRMSYSRNGSGPHRRLQPGAALRPPMRRDAHTVTEEPTCPPFHTTVDAALVPATRGAS